MTDAISDKKSLFKPVAAYLLAIALPLLALWVIDRNNSAAPVKLDVAQLAKAGWQTASGANDYVDWQPQINSPSAQFQQVFANGKQKVGVYIAYYRQQSYERKLVSSDNVLVKSEESAWSQVERGSKAVKLGQQELEVRTGLLRQGAVSSTEPKRIATWQWYWLNGYETASDAKGKLYSAIAKLKGQGDDGAMVILYSLENSATDGDAAIKQFALDNGDAIRSMLAQTRAIR